MTGLQIALFDGLKITGGGITDRALMTRKTRALIAYLALRGDSGQSREKLAELLWSNSAEEQARANLRQSLSSLRKALNSDGAVSLVADSDQISLAGPGIEVDVALFEQLVAEATPEALIRAAELYKGDLLDGFSLKEDPFEAWVRAERERLRHLASDMLTKLIAHCDEVGDTERCAETAARLLTLDPLRESAYRIMMRAYAAQGRQTLALKQFGTCRDILKRELGVEPEPETITLYREIRQQRVAVADDKLDSLPEHTFKNPPLPDGPSVAVLPFENRSGDLDQEYFSDGITEDIITALSKISSMLVIAGNSTFIYKGKAVDAKQVGRDQGVRYVLEGGVRKAGNQLRITAQLIDATNGQHLWAERYDRDLEGIFALQDEITQRIVTELDVHLSAGEQARLWSSGTNNLEAWECVRKGSDLLNTVQADLIPEATRLLERAIDLDPEYAAAWVWLGWSHFHVSENYESRFSEEERKQALKSTRNCAHQALKYDPENAEAYAALALCHLSSLEHEAAMVNINKSVQLEPNHATNIGISAAILNKCGRPEIAIERIRKAMRLSPVYPSWHLSILGQAYRLAGMIDVAIETYNELISIESGSLEGHIALAEIFGETNQPDQAAVSAKEVLKLIPDFTIKKYVNGLAYRDPAENLRFADGLRKAGLPD